MTSSIVSDEDLTWISGFGPVPTDKLDLAKCEHELRVYALTEASARSLSETLAFAAQFSAEEVYAAYADIIDDEVYFTFEIKGNTKPQTLSLRYMADRWSAVESQGANSTSTRKKGAPIKPSVKTIYHAFVESELVNKVGAELGVTVTESALVRINFKEKTYALVMHSDKASALPDQSIQSATIPRLKSTTGATMTPAEQSPTTPSDESGSDSTSASNENHEEKNPSKNEELASDVSSGPEDPADETNAADGLEAAAKQSESQSDPSQEVTADFTPEQKVAIEGFDIASAAMKTAHPEPESAKHSAAKARDEKSERGSKTFQNSPGKEAPAKAGKSPQSSPERVSFAPPQQSSAPYQGSAKYESYSKSEVDNLIKKSAENVTTAVTSKMNAHQKSLKEGLNNHEFAVKQSVDKLKQQVDEATSKLHKASNELDSKATEQSDQFKTSLKKEMEEFKGQMNKSVSPTIKALEAKLEQLNEAKKKVDSSSPTNKGPSQGLLIAVLLAVGLAIVNLIVGYIAFDRISKLEEENTKLMKTTVPSVSDVPVPDLMKEQIDKQSAQPQSQPK